MHQRDRARGQTLPRLRTLSAAPITTAGGRHGAAGNHRPFVHISSAAALLCAGLEALVDEDEHAARARRAPIPAIASALLSAASACVPHSPAGTDTVAFQLSLIARGETTWEHLRRNV